MDHVRRPRPARTAPIRSWSQLLTRPATVAPAPTTEPAQPDPAVADVIGRSVDLAYRVIDDYIQQGQRAAAKATRGAYGPAAFTADVQDWSAGMLRYASELAELWMGVASRFPGAAPPANGDTPPPESTAPAPSPVAPSAPVAVEVVAARPTSVAVDVAAASQSKPLVIRPLRGMTPTAPALAGVAFVPSAGDQPARLTVRVPADQPPGAYHGVAIDAESNLPVGTVTVRIADG